jgi:hypothetical protein
LNTRHNPGDTKNRYPIKKEREPTLVGRVGGTITGKGYTTIGGVATGEQVNSGEYSTQGGYEEALRASAVLSFSQTVATTGQGAGRT